MSLSAAILQAIRTARSAAGAAITYSRGGSDVTLTAVVGRTPFEQVSESGMVTRFESRDFLIVAAELILDGNETLPAAGDQIRETVGGEVLVYEVLERPGIPPYRLTDQFRRALRVHTKHIATE